MWNYLHFKVWIMSIFSEQLFVKWSLEGNFKFHTRPVDGWCQVKDKNLGIKMIKKKTRFNLHPRIICALSFRTKRFVRKDNIRKFLQFFYKKPTYSEKCTLNSLQRMYYIIYTTRCTVEGFNRSLTEICSNALKYCSYWSKFKID